MSAWPKHYSHSILEGGTNGQMTWCIFWITIRPFRKTRLSRVNGMTRKVPFLKEICTQTGWVGLITCRLGSRISRAWIMTLRSSYLKGLTIWNQIRNLNLSQVFLKTLMSPFKDLLIITHQLQELITRTSAQVHTRWLPYLKTLTMLLRGQAWPISMVAA